MDEHEIVIPEKFKKVLRKKPSRLQAAVLRCIAQLSKDLKHPGLHVHKMQGKKEEVFEAYVDRANRLTFHWEGQAIILRMNCNHDMLRRNP